MSKQFRVYLLPADIEMLMEYLRANAAFSILAESSAKSRPVALESPLQKGLLDTDGKQSHHVRCFLAPLDAVNLQMAYFSKRKEWLLRLESDIVEFSGCDFDGGHILHIGRFYFQTDSLIGANIWPKKTEFLQWADDIFRLSKRRLTYSKTFGAYVGEEAARFKQAGGCFASGYDRTGRPICED
jgi:hypothetical protein